MGNFVGECAVFDFVAHEEEQALVFIVGDFEARGAAHEDLLDLRAGEQGLVAQHRHINRHGAPAEEEEAALGDDFFGDLAAAGGVVVVGARQKHHAHTKVGILVNMVAQFFDDAFEEFVGNLSQHACSVAGFCVGI